MMLQSSPQIIMLLTPDTGQARLYCDHVQASPRSRQTLMFAHGSNQFGQIIAPEGVDVSMVAPKAPGHRVREVFQQGGGVPALVAVHQDASGHALDDALAYAKANRVNARRRADHHLRRRDGDRSVRRAGGLCAGSLRSRQAGFDTLVDAGYQPEVAYFECMQSSS